MNSVNEGATRECRTSIRTTDLPRLVALAQSWRGVLAHDAPNARPIVSSLLKGRVTITPSAKNEWTISGEGTLEGLFERTIYLQGWRPQRDSNPCFSLERATS